MSIHKGQLRQWKSCPALTTIWTVVHQASLSMGFSRQEYWSGKPFPLSGDIPTQISNLGLPHCRCILYCLSHQGSPRRSRINFKLGKELRHGSERMEGELNHSSFPRRVQFSSVQFSRSVLSNSLLSHESQHARPPCPPPTPGVHSDSCPSRQ